MTSSSFIELMEAFDSRTDRAFASLSDWMDFGVSDNSSDARDIFPA